MKKQFFINNLIMFLSLMIIPVLFFSFFSLYKVKSDIKKEVEEKSIATLSLSKSGIDIFFTDLYNYKSIIDLEPSANLLILQTLKADQSDYETAKIQSSLKNYIFSMLGNKIYIESVYFAIKDSEYFIDDGTRRNINNFVDKEWYIKYLDNKIPQPYLIEPRKIKNYDFETRTTDVTTIYQYTKFNGLMVININQRYFNNYLNEVSIYENQALVTLNQDNEVLFANKNFEKIPNSVFNKAVELMKNKSTGISTAGYYISYIDSPQYNLKYISFIPNNVIYKTTNIIIDYTFFAAIISFVLSCALAYLFTMRNYNQLNKIIKTFELAEQGKPIPLAVDEKNNAYFYILNNIINVFVNQSYLKAQLKSKKYSLINAQLAALQYQINPHFLFNTLQSIDIEIMRTSKQQTVANKMISQLSSILRYSLNDPMKLVTIAKEIEITKYYIEIQKYRSNTKIEVFWEYTQEILSEKTLRLLIQPIIENSIYHAHEKHDNSILIKVKIYKKNDNIIFKIIDNGTGIMPEQLKKINESLFDFETPETGKHIGLRNINKRLCIKYSENCGIKIKSKYGLGTVVSFMLSTNCDLKEIDNDTF